MSKKVIASKKGNRFFRCILENIWKPNSGISGMFPGISAIVWALTGIEDTNLIQMHQKTKNVQ